MFDCPLYLTRYQHVRRCVLCQPSAVYCANQTLCTVLTKRRVPCQTSAVYWPNQRHFHRISGHGGSHAQVEAKGPIAIPELVFKHVDKPAAKSDIVFVITIRPNTRNTASPSKQAGFCVLRFVRKISLTFKSYDNTIRFT